MAAEGIRTIKNIACCLCIPFLCSCYYLQQGSTLLKYHCSAESNKSLIADSSTQKDIRNFLINVETICRFAVEKVGLNKNKNFSCFVNVNRDYLIDNVYAARADTFAQYFWHYPFFGAMPYKGYFDRKGAEKEAEKLKKKGYDVLIGEVSGFSTLGILRDPVYSFMKNYGPYSLSSLIFHELTHATIFIKNQSQFNEEVATFVGDEASLYYIGEMYGTASDAYKKAQLYIEDTKTYYRLMGDLYLKLDSAYRNEKSRSLRIVSKNQIIENFKSDITSHYDSLFKTKSYNGLSKAVINNATILITRTYSCDLNIYYDLYQRCGNDLKKTVAELVALQKMKGDPKENLLEKMRK
jgi:predicted aminopeptidase